MKKIYALGLAVMTVAFSFAQDRQVGDQVKNWDRMTEIQDRSDDTLAPPAYSQACVTNGFTLYSSNNGGYVNGVNGYGDIGFSQRFPLDGSADVEGFMVWYGAIENVDGGTQFQGSLMDKDGTTVLGAVGGPHTVTAIDTTSTGAAGWHTYTLSASVAVTDTFFCQVIWAMGSDTAGVVSTIDACGDDAYEIWSDGTLAKVSASWGIAIDLGVLALVNNLAITGIFDQSVANFGIYQNGTNLHVNGIDENALVNNVQIIDMSGRVVKTFAVVDQWDNYTFDISDINAGNYIISMMTSKGNFAQKFNLK